jgi:hypothetical protein
MAGQESEQNTRTASTPPLLAKESVEAADSKLVIGS